MLRYASVVLALAMGCSSAGPDETESSEGAATAEARTQLDEFTGEWKVESDASPLGKVFPDAVSIQVTDDAIDPTTKTTKGTRLRIMRSDKPRVPATSGAPFMRVDEGKKCENVAQGGASSITICHDSRLNAGRTLTHTVTLRAWEGYIFPAGWETATQTLTLSGERMHYTYTVDDQLSQDVTLVR